MTKKQKSIVMELIAFADSNIESPCYGCTSRSCLGIEQCPSTKWGYEIVEKARNLLERKPNIGKK